MATRSTHARDLTQLKLHQKWAQRAIFKTQDSSASQSLNYKIGAVYSEIKSRKIKNIFMLLFSSQLLKKPSDARFHDGA